MKAGAQVVKDTQVVVIKDTIPVVSADTVLRIRNLNPYFTIHVDSTLSYQFQINKDPTRYYWYLAHSPVGLHIDKDNGLLTFKADKSYFLSGRLKYDNPYKVAIGVQSLDNPTDRFDTNFTVLFYNTEIIPSRIKPSVASNLEASEGDTVNFTVQCDDGSFPIEEITFSTNTPINDYTSVEHCGDRFKWFVPYDFVKAGDPDGKRTLVLSFIGTDKFFNKDTAVVRIEVKTAINYPEQLGEYNKLTHDIRFYVLQLKYTFMVLDKQIKSNKHIRNGFDLGSASFALGGTVASSLPNSSGTPTGAILPGVGVALVPVKEASAPQKTTEQNAASAIRTNVKRLEYSLSDNALVGDRDPDIINKTKTLRADLKQVQLILIDVPLEIAENLNEEQLNAYFNNPKVNKKYRMSH